MNTADMMIHVHPELDVHERADLEKKVLGQIGVDCAEFNRHEHPHALLVKYDPDRVEGMEILQIVRKVDPVASMVGM